MTVQIITGGCIETMRSLADGIAQTCVTSPPYFGLRDYGHADQIGLEPTPDQFVAKLVEVFREVRRVLRDDGTLWLNLGDSYAGSGRGGYPGGSGTLQGSTVGQDGSRTAEEVSHAQRKNCPTTKGSRLPAGVHESVGLKNKDLIGIPWRVAFALQADGWYLRQDIIWHKPNPMPESVTDRCTKAHEYVFLLSKSERYYFDAETIAEPISESSIARLSQDVESQTGSDRVPGKTNGNRKAVGRSGNSQRKSRPGLLGDSRHQQGSVPWEGSTRNKRSVWTVTTKPFKGAHFATFPPDLIEPCILAGSPRGGTVLDPFGGAGTTGLVADRHGRNAILCELNPAYADMARDRVRGDSPLFAQVAA